MDISSNVLSRRKALSLSLLLCGAGCNRSERKRIGVVPKGRAHMFWQSVHAGAVKASREKNVELEWNGPASEADFNAQLQIVESMINKRMDAIGLAPIDRRAMVSVVERATRAGVPVIIFDSGIDTEQFVAQVATDNYQAGAMAARRLGELVGGKGKVAIVATMAGAASTLAREQGFEDEVKKSFPGITVVDKRFGDSEVAKSLRVAENMLTAHGDLVGMFASNESSTVGAAQSLKGRGRKLQLVGFDSGPTLEADLRGGTINSLVVQHPFQMGYETVVNAVRHLGGEKVEKIQNLPPMLVTRENIDTPEVQARINPDLKTYLG